MSEFTQGICTDGAAILKDGVMLTVEEIIELLRQGDKLMGGGEPVAWMNEHGETLSAAQKATGLYFDCEAFTVPLYTGPQAAQVDDAVLRDAVADAIGRDVYDCSRVWSAWGHGTMSEDDFTPIISDINRLQEIVDAVKAAMKGEG